MAVAVARRRIHRSMAAIGIPRRSLLAGILIKPILCEAVRREREPRVMGIVVVKVLPSIIIIGLTIRIARAGGALPALGAPDEVSQW